MKLDVIFSIGCLEIELEAFLDSILTQWQPFMFCDISVTQHSTLSTDGNVNIEVWISIKEAIMRHREEKRMKN